MMLGRTGCAGGRRSLGAAPLAVTFLVALASLSGCAAGAQKNVIETAMANDAERAKAFEATARALDEHPEYVDQFYAVARRHDATMSRFLRDATRDLHEPPLARQTAALLAANPASLEEVLVAIIDAAEPEAGARAAIGRAVVRRSERLADILTDDPRAVTRATDALVPAVQRKPGARTAFLAAMRHTAPAISEIVKHDPDTMKVLMGAMLEQENRHGLDQFLRSFGFTK